MSHSILVCVFGKIMHYVTEVSKYAVIFCFVLH